MKRYRTIVLLVCCILVAGCAKDDPRLNGSWKSDVELSMTWNRANTHLTAKLDSALSQLLGHMTITYSPGGKRIVVMEPYTFIDGTNTYVRTGFTNAGSYNVFKRTENTTVLKTKFRFMTNHVETLNFEGSGIYWVLLDMDKSATPVREYFKKIKEPNK
jgi:hypothetical protein